jgi:hypothetical protein
VISELSKKNTATKSKLGYIRAYVIDRKVNRKCQDQKRGKNERIIRLLKEGTRKIHF